MQASRNKGSMSRRRRNQRELDESDVERRLDEADVEEFRNEAWMASGRRNDNSMMMKDVTTADDGRW